MDAVAEAKEYRAAKDRIYSPLEVGRIVDGLLDIIEPPMWPHKCSEFDGLIACGEECSWCGASETVFVDAEGRN